MRVKVITKDHGEYTSDKITEIVSNELNDIVDRASQGNLSNLQFKYNGDRIFFTGEVLKTSVFIVMED